MNEKAGTTRSVKVFRYDPVGGGADPGHFDTFTLEIPDEATTTILDVLLRLQREQDASLSFRYACRVNMCGSCAMVINGKEALACKTNVSRFKQGQEITIRPLNHFPVIKDLVVDMEPFFRKYEECLPYYDPKEPHDEPARIRPDSPERLDIGLSTECIACGCCVSSCTMCHYHDGYAGPAALNRAFTLLADSRDGLYEERLTRVLDSCYHCRTELNCTDVCPKGISGTRAIKHIQLLALRRRKPDPQPLAAAAAPAPADEAALAPVEVPHERCAHARAADGVGGDPLWPAQATSPAPFIEALAGGPRTAVPVPPEVPPAAALPPAVMDRRGFLERAGIGLLGLGSIVTLGGVAGAAVVGPTLARSKRTWIPVGSLDGMRDGDVTTVVMNYDVKTGLYRQQISAPVLVSRTGNGIVCFKANCPHLGCIVKWEALSGRFRCACHGGTFDRDGTVLGGPPPRPLDRYDFKVDSGHLLVEVSA